LRHFEIPCDLQVITGQHIKHAVSIVGYHKILLVALIEIGLDQALITILGVAKSNA